MDCMSNRVAARTAREAFLNVCGLLLSEDLHASEIMLLKLELQKRPDPGSDRSSAANTDIVNALQGNCNMPLPCAHAQLRSTCSSQSLLLGD